MNKESKPSPQGERSRATYTSYFYFGRFSSSGPSITRLFDGISPGKICKFILILELYATKF